MTLMKPTKALLWQHSCTSGGVCVQFLLLLPPLHVWKYSVGLSNPYSGDPLLGKLPTLSDGTCCRAGKLRPEQNALSPKQHFVGWEGTLPSRCQRSVARSSVMGTFYRQGQPPLPDSVVSVVGDTGNHVILRDVERRWLCSTKGSQGERRSVTLAKDHWSKAQPAKVQDWHRLHAASSQYFCKPVKLEMI